MPLGLCHNACVTRLFGEVFCHQVNVGMISKYGVYGMLYYGRCKYVQVCVWIWQVWWVMIDMLRMIWIDVRWKWAGMRKYW